MSHGLPFCKFLVFMNEICLESVEIGDMMVKDLGFGNFMCLQCFDAIGWVAGRASGL